MSNEAAFDRLDRLRAMSEKKPGTSGFSKGDIEAIQMAVDVLDLLVHVDRYHDATLSMFHTADSNKPIMLLLGRRDKHYGETGFECFVKAAKALEQVKPQNERTFTQRSKP